MGPGPGRSDRVSRRPKHCWIISAESLGSYSLCIFSAEGSAGFRRRSAPELENRVRKCQLGSTQANKKEHEIEAVSRLQASTAWRQCLADRLGCALHLHPARKLRGYSRRVGFKGHRAAIMVTPSDMTGGATPTVPLVDGVLAETAPN